jgi:hypothetical protein
MQLNTKTNPKHQDRIIINVSPDELVQKPQGGGGGDEFDEH